MRGRPTALLGWYTGGLEDFNAAGVAQLAGMGTGAHAAL